jgi:hypothetical protein
MRGRSIRSSCCGAALLTAAMVATAAAAGDLATCRKESGQTAVAACTAAISSEKLHGHELAVAYFNRAFNLHKMSDPARPRIRSRLE